MSSTYLSSEQMKKIPEDGLMKCTELEAAKFAAHDANLTAIRFIQNGELVHATVSKEDLLKATGRTR